MHDGSRCDIMKIVHVRHVTFSRHYTVSLTRSDVSHVRASSSHVFTSFRMNFNKHNFEHSGREKEGGGRRLDREKQFGERRRLNKEKKKKMEQNGIAKYKPFARLGKVQQQRGGTAWERERER